MENRKFHAKSPNKIWGSDIIYLISNGRRAYLSTILDLYDRKIVVYKISNRNDLNIIIDTLNEAISKRKDVEGIITHFDQGIDFVEDWLLFSNTIRLKSNKKIRIQINVVP